MAGICVTYSIMIFKYLRGGIGGVRILMYYLFLWFIEMCNESTGRESSKEGHEFKVPITNIVPVSHSVRHGRLFTLALSCSAKK